VEKAEHDLKAAAHLLGMGKDCPTDTVCFHAQQTAEKYLKAYLVVSGTDFPKSHDVEALIAMLPSTILPGITMEDQRRLTAYATVTRYPGGYEAIPLAEARRALRLARQVRRIIRKSLPRKVLCSRKR
jgi:HEPN domain-containing protein